MHIVKQKYTLLMLGAACLVGLLTACKPSSESAEHTLTMGTSADYPPFEFQHQGEIQGFDIDVAKAITQELGYKLRIQDMDFSGIIPALKSGRIDFAMASITATPERSQSVDFSTSYFSPRFAVVSPKKAPIKNLEDLANKKIGVQLGSTMESFIKEEAQELPGITIVALGRNPQLIQELKVGRLDGVILEDMQAQAFTKKNPSLETAILPQGEFGFSIAFAKDSPLQEPFNKAIKSLKASGKLQELQEQWLHIDDDDA